MRFTLMKFLLCLELGNARNNQRDKAHVFWNAGPNAMNGAGIQFLSDLIDEPFTRREALFPVMVTRRDETL